MFTNSSFSTVITIKQFVRLHILVSYRQCNIQQLGKKINPIVMVSLNTLVEENLESELSLAESKLSELDQKLQKVNWLIKELETLLEVESKTSEQLAEQLLEYVELHESLANALELALLMPHKPTLTAIKSKLKVWESRLDESNKLLSTLMRATVDPTCW